MTTPDRLGKYTISEVLGRGAMGVVYKGFDPHIRRTVALKTIRKDLIDEDQAGSLLARFQNEARAAGRLSHPGIVAVYEYDEAGALAFLAMEYVEGNSLREYFNRGTRFAAADVVSIMAQLLDALGSAHEQGVWHRDVKPANLIIMTNGRLKVADFGIARIDSSNLTQTGAILGTPGYMAPEQYAGVMVDWRADLFSAGVVFYQLLTGTRPFTGAAEAIAYKICYEAPLPPSQADPDACSTQFDAIMETALAKKPEARFQTAHAFRDALLEAYAQPVSRAVSEETIITEIVKPSAHHDKSTPSQPRSPTVPPLPATLPPPGWDAEVLAQVRDQLAPLVGPVAKFMVKRAAASTTDIDALYRLLAQNLTTGDEQRTFLEGRKRLKGVAAESATTTLQVAGDFADPAEEAAVPLTPEAIDRASKRLAAFVGPIAGVLARKAATRATSERHFHRLLADKLESQAERERFLNELAR